MEKPTPPQFNIPLSFPSISILSNGSYTSQPQTSALEKSLANSTPTASASWGLSKSATSNKERNKLVVVGCKDGTAYVLQTSLPSFSTPSDRSQSKELPSSKSATRTAKSFPSSSGTSSPTLSSFPLSPTFSVTAKPRVVSGVTTDSVEAPKNYVDFDDEPDRLKDILKGKNPRDRHSISENSSDRNPRSVTPSIIEPVSVSKRKGAAPRSLLSATNSRAPTPTSFSSPNSPMESDSVSNSNPDLARDEVCTLLYHVIPSQSGCGYPVRSIIFLHDGDLFAVLQENGNLYIFSSEDGYCVASFKIGEDIQSNSQKGHKERTGPRDVWSWSSINIAYVEESVIILATAANNNDISAPNSDNEGVSATSLCALLEFVLTPSGASLHKLGQWDVNGPASGNGIHGKSDGTFTFFSTSHNGHLILKELNLKGLPSPPVKTTSETEGNHYGPHLSTLPIPNPFKSMMTRSTEHLVTDSSEIHMPPVNGFKPTLGEPHDIGTIIEDTALSGLVTRHSADGNFFALAWSHRELAMFQFSHQSITVLSCIPVNEIEDAAWVNDEIFVLSFEEKLEQYRLKSVNSDNDSVDNVASASSTAHLQAELIYTLNVGEHDTINFCHDSAVLTKFTNFPQEKQLIAYNLSNHKFIRDPHQVPKVLWSVPAPTTPPSNPFLTSMLSLELELIIQGYSDGLLRQFSLAQMTRKTDTSLIEASSSSKTSDRRLNGSLVGLHLVQNPRTREKFIVGGADDGSIAFWSLSKFELVARWTVFVTPLAKVIQFEADTTGPLRGCALCVARDGTIAVIIVDGFHFRYLIPGSVAPLKRVCLGGNNLLVIYEDRRARLWDSQTKELWRSFGEDKVEELLSQGGWIDMSLDKDASVPKSVWTPVGDSIDKQDAAASLVLNLEKIIVDSIQVTKTISTSRDEVREILLTLERLRLLLSVLITPGLNSDVDSICYGKLGAYPSSALVGLSSPGSTTLVQHDRPQDVWRISSVLTASRALAIIAVLRAMSLFEDLTEGATTVISFYSASLSTCVGSQFKVPSLEFLGKLWFEASNELRQPIRTLFNATVSNMTDEESIAITEKWQHCVPSLQPDAEKETESAALALFICGSIASEKFTLLSPSALTDISKSISLYLTDEKSVYRILAVDLCSRGFNVWQHYIDAMDILRSLFDLATSVRKDSISVQNIGTQARLAVLSIASNNMPLFMGTLCLDILSPPSVEHQRSVLQILAFLIRKRPYILQPSLPRLMEAVVKSLDPNSTSNREVVLDTATEIIGYVVKTYPSVDFHMATQRLAVGTNEGAVVMYDCKNAIRLYVLEGHKKPITACSFSPDGRRLITISLKDSSVLVWKVGSSFASFFNPGAPPRQGHGGSQPFKTLNFNIGSEADMTTAETLELVRIEWIADRSVRVKIRQSVMTFST
ncbi:WD repeat-containing protein 7 [Psilocybe cubensis]|uniref:WD repeat-containing protein 7 n=2 Tax=Psilocybe cubensis TaxID=181762 RepID=A0ACB8GXY8_PSICU|nr:WD repeat-containing protein 7 [Psilocybe cubensis]KAH9480388.1 WD repeat-containing protein 7 [Psilocybe cubensis]